MKHTSTLPLWLSIAAGAALCAAVLSRAAAPAPAPDPAPGSAQAAPAERWEYRTIPLLTGTDSRALVARESEASPGTNDIIARIEQRLNAQGRQGWVLVTVSYDLAIFRRPAR